LKNSLILCRSVADWASAAFMRSSMISTLAPNPVTGPPTLTALRMPRAVVITSNSVFRFGSIRVAGKRRW
jgi:hypothetical protein